MSEVVLVAVGTGVASGLVTWGAIRVQLAWLRRDVDHAHERIDAAEDLIRRVNNAKETL